LKRDAPAAARAYEQSVIRRRFGYNGPAILDEAFTLPEADSRMPSLVEQHYQARMDALLPRERMARSMSLLKWTRDLLARQIVAERGPMSNERLKWEVARRLYAADAAAVAMIDRILAHVPS
jgi:hypothetical protein